MAQKKNITEKSLVTKKAKRGAPLSGGTGRRKSAVSRVWVRPGSGAVLINGIDFKKYFDTSSMILAVEKPFVACPIASTYDFDVKVEGGGKVGQSHAVKLGLSRALVALNPSLRGDLRQHGLLTVDARVKERKKYGQRGARRGFQFVKR